MARAASVAAEHARGRITARTTLSAAGKDSPVLSTLQPLIEPLARLLEELGGLDALGRASRPGGGGAGG